MAEFKKLSDVEVVETPMDTANVLIEEDGVIKKAPKSAVGTVKSVNGIEADENGNVAIETASSWNDLANKPFYEEVVDGETVIHQIDKKFIPNLPYCVEVYNHGDNNYTCDLSYGDIEDILSTGTLVYAVIKCENVINGGWYVDTNSGYFYFGYYTMPDDDVLTFVRPDGKGYLTFFAGGSIALGFN